MTTMGTGEAIILAALKKTSQALVTKAVTKSKEAVQKKFKNATGPRKLKNFSDNCNLYLYSRTLFSTHKNIHIDDFYVPLTISPTDDRERIIEVSELKFSSPGITNIIGKAGQGKSTILKKLFKNELSTGESFPIFFELKNFNSKSLTKQISDWFLRKNLKIDEDIVKFLLKEKKLTIFLDAFDEINPELHDKAVEEIESFSITYPKTPIIITTRPETQIINQLCVNNYQLNDINENQIRAIFEIISEGNTDRVESAIHELNKNKEIYAVINTPILAVLLFLTYKVWTEIPSNLSNFYNKVFGTLLRWHDSLKSGKKITRISLPINDNKVEEVFERICFKSFTANTQDFNESELLKIIEEALTDKNIDPSIAPSYSKFIRETKGYYAQMDLIVSFSYTNPFKNIFVHPTYPSFQNKKDHHFTAP